MGDATKPAPDQPKTHVEELKSLSNRDVIELCEATETAIEDGGGFGWVDIPDRDVLERFWKGVLAIPQRRLFAARLDGFICGSAQLILTPSNNQAQQHVGQLSSLFIAPWARKYGLGKDLLTLVEKVAKTYECKILNCDVRETQQEMLKLLESSGYTKYGTHPSYAVIKGKTLAGHYFSKELAK